MAKEKREQSSNGELVAAMNAAYRPIMTFMEQAHRQEHRFEKKYGYGKLQSRFDKLNGCARKWRRKILDRIEEFGGEVDSAMDPIKVSDDVATAYSDTLESLDSIYSALKQAVAVAMGSNDHPSTVMLMKIQKKVDSKIKDYEKHQRMAADLGDKYLLTLT